MKNEIECSIMSTPSWNSMGCKMIYITIYCQNFVI